jgi:hypothetical protein
MKSLQEKDFEGNQRTQRLYMNNFDCIQQEVQYELQIADLPPTTVNPPWETYKPGQHVEVNEG